MTHPYLYRKIEELAERAERQEQLKKNYHEIELLEIGNKKYLKTTTYEHFKDEPTLQEFRKVLLDR